VLPLQEKHVEQEDVEENAEEEFSENAEEESKKLKEQLKKLLPKEDVLVQLKQSKNVEQHQLHHQPDAETATLENVTKNVLEESEDLQEDPEEEEENFWEKEEDMQKEEAESSENTETLKKDSTD